jgi:hypothetical protein
LVNADIAFYKDKPNNVKVGYKYELHERVNPTEESLRLNSTSKKSTEEKEEIDIAEKYPIDKKLFEGKSILIIGGGSREVDYKEVFEQLDVEFQLSTGDEPIPTISSMIEKADAVAIAFGECSHFASTYAVEICKKNGVPFQSTSRIGIQSILLCVEKAILKGMDDSYGIELPTT